MLTSSTRIILVQPFHKLKDHEVSGSRLPSERGRIWEPDDGLVCRVPPVVGLSKTHHTEGKQASSTNRIGQSCTFSQHNTSTKLAKKSISEREIDWIMKADSATLSKQKQNYQKIRKNNKQRLSESHPSENLEDTKRKVTPPVAAINTPRAIGKCTEDDDCQFGCESYMNHPRITKEEKERLKTDDDSSYYKDPDTGPVCIRHPPCELRAKMTITQRDCVVQHHLHTPDTGQTWVSLWIEDQETDNNKSREALTTFGDERKSTTSKPVKQQNHVQRVPYYKYKDTSSMTKLVTQLLQMCGDHCKEDTDNWEIVSFTKLRDEARYHVGHKRRIIHTRQTTLHMKEGVIPIPQGYERKPHTSR